MSHRSEVLGNRQWGTTDPQLPELMSRGRPWRSNREVFEGILWALRADTYPSRSTCWSRLGCWEEDGRWLRVWRTFIDGSFAAAKKGPAVGKPKRGKGTKLMVVANGQDIPVGGYLFWPHLRK